MYMQVVSNHAFYSACNFHLHVLYKNVLFVLLYALWGLNRFN